jgi:hypothetical protein
MLINIAPKKNPEIFNCSGLFIETIFKV